MPDTRRDFFRSLVAGGATVTADLHGLPLKHRKADKAPNQQIYHGPMSIPPDVAEAIRDAPDLHRCSNRHLAAKYVDGDGIKWIAKCRVPESRQMVGEIVRTPEGVYRVHAWTVARIGEYRDARDRISKHREPETISENQFGEELLSGQ